MLWIFTHDSRHLVFREKGPKAELCKTCFVNNFMLYPSSSVAFKKTWFFQNIALASKSLIFHAQWILLRRGYLLPYPSPVTYALAHEWSGKKYISYDNYRTIILYKRKLGENDYGTQGLFDFLWVELSCFVVVGTKLNVSQGDLTEKSLSMNLCRCTREISQCLICREKGLLCSIDRLF